MKLRARQLVLLTIAGVGLAAGLGVWGYYWRAKRAVADYRKQLIAAGEKLTVAELIPSPPPEEQNGADLFLKAQALLNVSGGLLDTNPPYAMTMVAPGKAMIRWQQPAIRDASDRKVTNSWEEAEAELTKVAPGLALLDQLAQKRVIDFHYDYHQGFFGRLSNLSPLKHSAQLLGAVVIVALQQGDTEAATAHLRGMLAIVRGTTGERLLVSQLVRFAIAAITFGDTWELLQSPHVTDEQLAALQRDWSDLDFISATENALMMERAVNEMTIGDMRESSTEFNRVTTGFGWPGAGAGAGAGGGAAAGNWFDQAQHFAEKTWEGTKEKSREVAWRVAWSYPDQLRMLQGEQVLIEALRQVRSNGNFHAAWQMQEAKLNEFGFFADKRKADETGNLFDDGLDLQSLFSQGVESLGRVINRAMIAETSKQLVTTALALKRYQLRHGNLPPDLAALSPEFLPTIPLDPVNAQPLRYQPDRDGTFLLYSVGEDAEDNGGDPKPAAANAKSISWQRGRDWVWPQPASEKEIQEHFDKVKRE